jgi:hypothetical protein
MEGLGAFGHQIEWQKVGFVLGNYAATSVASWSLKAPCPATPACPALSCAPLPLAVPCPDTVCGSCSCEALPVGLGVLLLAFVAGIFFGIVIIGGWFAVLLFRIPEGGLQSVVPSAASLVTSTLPVLAVTSAVWSAPAAAEDTFAAGVLPVASPPLSPSGSSHSPARPAPLVATPASRRLAALQDGRA